jgi:hypothetical protein
MLHFQKLESLKSASRDRSNLPKIPPPYAFCKCLNLRGYEIRTAFALKGEKRSNEMHASRTDPEDRARFGVCGSRLRASKVVVDGKKVGEIRNRETKNFLSPVSGGQHDLSLKIDWCGSPGDLPTGCILGHLLLF